MMAAWLFSASLCSIYWLFCKLNFGSFLFGNIHSLCSMCLIFSPFISLNVLVGRHDATGPRYPWEMTLTQHFGSQLTIATIALLTLISFFVFQQKSEVTSIFWSGIIIKTSSLAWDRHDICQNVADFGHVLCYPNARDALKSWNSSRLVLKFP